MNTSNPPSSSHAPRPWIIGLLVAVLTLVAYIPVVEAPFIWDDHQLILESPRVQELRPLREYWGNAFWAKGDMEPEGRSYYRPLAIYSLALDYAIHGKNASGYHIANALFHVANAVLLFALLRRRRLESLQAALLALTWGWFPRLTEAAAWISGRTDVLAAFFVFLALYLSGRERAVTRWAAALAALLGMFAKEVAAAGLAAVAVNEWFARRDLAVQQRVLRIVPIGCAALVYGAARFWAMGSGVNSSDLPVLVRALFGVEALGRYVAMLADGWQPDVQIGFLGALSPPHVALGALLLIGSSVWLWRRGKSLDTDGLTALTLLGVSLGLVLHVVPISVNVVAADRFMYVPLAGLVLLVAPLARRPLRHPAFAVVALLAASFAVTTFRRAGVWADEVEFWAAQFRAKQRFTAMSRLELGNVYARAGLRTYALALYMNSDARDYANYLLALHNSALVYNADGRLAEARALLERVVHAAPAVPKFRFTLALLDLSEHKLDEAEKDLATAEKMYPDMSTIPKLKKGIAKIRELDKEPPLDESTRPGQLKLAMRLAVLGRPKESLDELVKASAQPDITVSDLTSAILYAFDWGSPKQLTALYKRYREIGGNSPVFEENYNLRMERVNRLKALWPTLAQYAPPQPKPIESTVGSAKGPENGTTAPNVAAPDHSTRSSASPTPPSASK